MHKVTSVKKNLVEGNPFEIEVLILIFAGILTSSLEYRGEYYFFAFRFAILLSLLTLPLLSFFFGVAALPELGAFLTRSRSLPRVFTPPFPIAIRAFFFAKRLATRSASVDLYCLRASFAMWASFSPSRGSPLGTTMGTGADLIAGLLDLASVVTCRVDIEEPGIVLHR